MDRGQQQYKTIHFSLAYPIFDGNYTIIGTKLAKYLLATPILNRNYIIIG